MEVFWSAEAMEHMLYWSKHDKTKVKKIQELVRAIQTDPTQGIGQPEALKFEMTGYGSCRISREHRLVYELRKGHVVIHQCKFHY